MAKNTDGLNSQRIVSRTVISHRGSPPVGRRLLRKGKGWGERRSCYEKREGKRGRRRRRRRTDCLLALLFICPLTHPFRDGAGRAREWWNIGKKGRWLSVRGNVCRNRATQVPGNVYCIYCSKPFSPPLTVHLFTPPLPPPSECLSKHPKTGGVGIELDYEDSTQIFTPEQIVACMLTKVNITHYLVPVDANGG